MNWDGVFFGLLVFLFLQRLVELLVNRRNVARLVAQGGRVVRDDGYLALVAVHAALFVLLPAEWYLAPWAGPHILSWALLAVFGAAESIRLWAAFTLGHRWTTQVVVLPDAPLVTGGPYRWLRHPIYSALRVELFVLPLAFGLPISAVLLGIGNVVATGIRARREDAAWRVVSASNA